MIDPQRDCIFLALSGSHAYGTAREGSDVDVRGVGVVPLSSRVSLFERQETLEGPLDGRLPPGALERLLAHPTAATCLAVKLEGVIHDLPKYVSLCAASNPTALELLFCDQREWLFWTPEWETLSEHRRQFLCRTVKDTFQGYALAQLKKIKSHRSWLLEPPAAPPVRASFGLPEQRTISREDEHRLEQAIGDRIRAYGVDDLELPRPVRAAIDTRLRLLWTDLLAVSEAGLEDRLRTTAIGALQIPKEVAQALAAERRYLRARREWESYQLWKAQRNPARAELERNHGYDTKHGMHLVRLMRMGLELLTTGELHVRREDAAELLAIRDGALDYEQLTAHAESLRERMEQAVTTSPLPTTVDLQFIDALAVELVERRSWNLGRRTPE